MAVCTCRVESCMGCIPLQRGAIIIGFLYLFGSMLETFKYMYVLVEFELKVKQCEETKPRRSPGSPGIVDDDDMKYDIYETLRDELRFCPKGRMLALARSSIIIPIFILFIYFILTALMIHGVRQERSKLIAPWLWWQLSLLVVSLLGIIGLQSLEDFLFKITILVVAMYLFMVVNSYYLKLLQQERNPSRVTVIAMARPRNEMTVSFPSPLKDDPPPPYNSCYIPSEAMYPPPYDNNTATYANSPPPYQSMDPLEPSGSGSAPGESHPNPATTAPTQATQATSSSDNANPVTPNPVTPNPATPNISHSTQDVQEGEASSQDSISISITPEATGERIPLVVKLSTSQNN
ncbi:hypothetical protein GWK47_030282 [Chionoecetes opilio]|uniref:Uncharacterized protein n=1 Tax=Chionoecetes opilio TaxID=41210 RepID=A0A8J4YRV5_CHIOP|nr:hypothetical protein GWK47_030282 [Chionoecetes opilio]